jgi:hypothetical protein
VRYAPARGWELLVVSALVVGCTHKDGPLVSISGRVNYRDKAVPGGTVLLQPESGKAFVAAINETGRYGASVPAGTYKVAVVSSAAIPEGVDPWKGKAKLPPPVVPDNFGRTETSGVSIVVRAHTSEAQTIDINL